MPRDTFRDALPEVRSISYNHFEQVIDFNLALDVARSNKQTFQIEMAKVVHLIHLYFHPYNTNWSARSNPLDPRYFVLRNKHWGRTIASDAVLASNKYRSGPIVCQALDGEIVTFKISTDQKHLEVSVDGARPNFEKSSDFSFKVEHSDYNKLIFYLYVNSLLSEASKDLKEIHESIDKLDLGEIENK